MNDGEPYVVLTVWENREAFETWTQSDPFRQGHARSGALPRDTELTRFQDMS